MKNLLNRKKHSKGMTLIELLLVVGLGAVILAGMFVAYNKIQSTNAANTESTNISTLRAGVKGIYGTSVTYVGLTPTVLLNGRVVPDSMRTAAGTTINNSFGGTVGVAPATYAGGAANNAFAITYPNVPVDVCAKLVVAVSQSFNLITVNGTTVKDSSTATGNDINVATLTTQCAATAAGASVVMTSL